MSRVELKGGALTSPLPPALVTVGEGEEANVLTVAWTGILATVPPCTYISVRKRRHSHALLVKHREFVIHLPPSRLVREVDFCGMYTGAKMNKLERCHLSAIPSVTVSAPTIAECPIALECRVSEIREMGSHDVFFADILRVTADEELFDEAGKLHIERADLLAYAHGDYYRLGKCVGSFGFSAKKKGGARQRRERRK
jgi:flavin reductase (DIM6/NTAB) family NADH-FMN oxidoreductase RutF